MTTNGQIDTAARDLQPDLSLRRDLLAHRAQRRETAPRAGENVIIECTPTERFGLRGPGTIDWIAAQDLVVPADVNTSAISPCGTTVMRLGQQEVLLAAPVAGNGERLRELRRAWRESPLPVKGYDAYRDEGWAWFVVSGPDAAALMRRISMADLRPENLKKNDIAQTRALHMDVVVARLDRFGAHSYDVFLDIASAKFALDVLTETAAELAVGFQVATWRYGPTAA